MKSEFSGWFHDTPKRRFRQLEAKNWENRQARFNKIRKCRAAEKNFIVFCINQDIWHGFCCIIRQYLKSKIFRKE
ncbi:hypothetical protein ANACOL_04371 [Anaerotruncus colihominis DSM 17241]|uniref:Uncharacterized protein n=1 Tax=Anaerotruncus colihominis DSM 17241 TaxID=445972 RepID=B0PHS7_9FIRM|nr:hypothetical protein ANACOL_04371 [Anaerotruncus colihominis DSM 17241]